jgi:hypothetical protein
MNERTKKYWLPWLVGKIIEGSCRWKLSSGNLCTFIRTKKLCTFIRTNQEHLRTTTNAFFAPVHLVIGLINLYKFPLDNFHLQDPTIIIESRVMLTRIIC